MPVSELRLDLTKTALRKSIFGQIVQNLAEDERYRAAQAMRDASTPKNARLETLADVNRAIDISVASSYAREQTRAVYQILAEAEGKVHGCAPEEAHFHEVGQGVTLRELLAIASAVEAASPERIVATPVQVGSGTVETEHGTLDVPAPATAAILEAYSIPIAEPRLEGELCTPTSAALIAHFVTEFE